MKLAQIGESKVQRLDQAIAPSNDKGTIATISLLKTEDKEIFSHPNRLSIIRTQVYNVIVIDLLL